MYYIFTNSNRQTNSVQENQQIFAPLNRSVCQLACTERKHVLLSLSRLSYSIYYIMVFRVRLRYSIPFRLYNVSDTSIAAAANGVSILRLRAASWSGQHINIFVCVFTSPGMR